MKLYSTLNSRWYRKARKRAYDRDPEYKRIEDLRDTGRGTSIFLASDLGLDLEAWDYQNDMENKFTRYPTYLKILAKIHHNNLDDPKYLYRQHIKWPLQRSKRGWADRDVWGLDTYLSAVISGSVGRLRSVLHGWPGEPMTFEEWEGILDDISAGFKMASKFDYWTEDAPERIYFNKCFDLFKTYYFHLWD